MNKKAGIYKEYKKHFLVDEGKLRKLYNIIREYGDKLAVPYLIKMTVRRMDKSFYETTEIDEVLADENADGRTIEFITMELHRKAESNDNIKETDFDRRKASIILILDRHDKEKVFFSIQGKNRDWCFLLADELDSNIRRVLTKSPILGNYPLAFVDLFVFIVLTGLLLFYLAFSITTTPPTLSVDQILSMTIDARTQKLLEMAVNRDSDILWFGPIMLVITAVMMTFIGLRPFSRLFAKMSRSVFYWGDVAPLHDAFEKRVSLIKWGVFIAFLVSFGASIISALMIN